MNQNLYLQEKNEEFEDYVDRIFDSWNKEKEKPRKTASLELQCSLFNSLLMESRMLK